MPNKFIRNRSKQPEKNQSEQKNNHEDDRDENKPCVQHIDEIV